MKRVNDFATGDPKKLNRELSQVESNVADEFQLVRRQTAPQPQVVSFTPTAALAIVAIQPDQQLSVDTTAASASVVFPPLAAANFGRRFTVIKRSFNNSIVMSCQDPKVSCNGAAFPTLVFGVIGATVFYCDATGYYR